MYNRTHSRITSPGKWRPLNGWVGVIGMDFYPTRPHHQFRNGTLDGALQNAELMAECEDLELQRRPAPEGSENGSPESRQQVFERESKGERQLPVYQSDRNLREPQTANCRLDEISADHSRLIGPSRGRRPQSLGNNSGTASHHA
jgi:hypothetical protein